MRLLLLLLLPACLLAATSEDEFETRVRPLLAERCMSCHGAAAASGLRLDSRAGLLQGGARGPAVVPGEPERSLLLRAVRQGDAALRMPPNGPLAAPEIAALEKWIRDGAVWPSAKPVAVTAKTFWSFEPLQAVSGSIDSIVRRGLQAKGIEPNPVADRRTLLRRLYFDLTGLPPMPAQSQRFLDGQSVPLLVDELLASKAFGERWGRHWLDVARFGEDDFTGTQPRPYANAWRYRDWVIDAFNQDMPYDQFVKAQLAADRLPGDNAKYLGGLGLFGGGPWYYGITQPPQARADERHDRVDMVSRGFLGLTAACARCHDHKYDPIPQTDYYALAGVFASSEYHEYPLADKAAIAAYDAAQQRIQKLEKQIDQFLVSQRDQLAEMFAARSADYLLGRPGIDTLIAANWKKYLAKKEEDHPFLKPWLASRDAAGAMAFQNELTGVIEQKKAMDEANRRAVIRAENPNLKRRKILLPGRYDSEADFNPGADVPTQSLDREHFQLWNQFIGGAEAVYRLKNDQVEQRLAGEWKAHLANLRSQLALAKKESPPPYGFHAGLGEHTEPIDLPLNLRGNPEQLGPVVPRAFLRCLSNGQPRALQQGSGRLQLAEAIVEHPLAARVMANRIWAWLYGAGVVRTPSNFGLMGERPANRELLEHLAGRFRTTGFSVKALVREIVLSESYQASSAANAANEKLDAENRLFWRANRKRLDAEEIRDALLAASGELDLRHGGESAELTDVNVRRTVYVKVGRYQQNETLALFDFPSASIHAEQRMVTNVPLQKLFFLNSRFMRRRAEMFAQHAECWGRSDRDRLLTAYRTLFSRAPSAAEERTGLVFLQQQSWAQYAQVLFSTNEFLYLD